MNFSEENIVALFGHEAAEDEDIEKLKSYYLKGSTFDKVSNDLPIRILVGHKGIGKSALFHISMDEERQNQKLSILIKPDDILGIGEEEENFLKLIREWKEGITRIIAEKALENLHIPGVSSNALSQGAKVVNYLRDTLRLDQFANLSSSQKAIIKKFQETGKIYIYIDDLDRGWTGHKKDIRNISALLNAIRDISTESKGICFRVSLRSDVYYLVRTSDESTDKIEGSVVWHSWTNHEILALLVKRVEAYFGRHHDADTLIASSQEALAKKLTSIMKPTFYGKGNWSKIPMHRMLMSLIRKRPRDLVKLCTLAAREASDNKLNMIDTACFESIFEDYSQGRLQDTINEYRSELPDIDRLLFGMKPNIKGRRTTSGYIYTTGDLLTKIGNIIHSGAFKFSDGKIADRQALASFMYKINFLTARKEIDQSTFITRRYFEESRYLSQKFANFGFDWEVHPAYRWALQPDSLANIFNQMEPSVD